ncbi:MAG: tyrosine--tRNA ligase [Nitrosopumilaceae archaeon]|nr:tyrosine--tRNA ligase [Nitrosopumilaceae archaeon]NIU00839.1 tyrosine--tRNA ligase [Nitrosopumilaceae archaeon]NIU87292.1 tyrosine--tRNA ligase [Nitrosopumilaceae archaeon]NIV65820.1 tyrosine--tRNA ligase [Nitrosopumilaceae archaeon]NIX61441.1 tyrosine--tRNA ligase [Nitrosopumilaceae archaeon]
MDVIKKVELVEKPPTQEIVTRDELIELFKTNSKPRHYIGLEISGFLHLGSLISTGFKINDFIEAGVDCTVFLADWHTLINDKLGSNWDTISKVSDYYKEAFEVVCPGVNIVLGSDLYDQRKEYWKELVRFTKNMSLARTMRTLTIMGRSENEEKIDLAKLLYPPMQAVDIHSLDIDIAHAGMDQRKIHMLVREIFPKMNWKVPVAVHHRLLPSLSKPSGSSQEAKLLDKMSKSAPDSGILIHNTDEEIREKIKRAWCELGNVENNPLLEIVKHIILHRFKEIKIERSARFGGDVLFTSYQELESVFKEKKLHPSDLKQAVGDYLVKIVGPIRDKLDLSEELREIIGKNH